MSKSKLTIIANSVDYTKDLFDFLNRDASIVLTQGNYMYVGYSKPINQIYNHITTPNVSETETVVEYYNGNTWVSVDDLEDNTYGMSQSGYINWTEYDSNSTIEKTIIDSKEMYWHRLSFSGDINMTIKGIGIVFSEDNDIFMESPTLDSDRARRSAVGGDATYIKVHVQVRDYILQELRNNGIMKYNSESDDDRLKFYRNIDEFDLFDLSEIKLAARMLAISNIYFRISDEVDDKWQYEGERYRHEYKKALDVAFISIDKNDDGELDSTENLKPIKDLRVMR